MRCTLRHLTHSTAGFVPAPTFPLRSLLLKKLKEYKAAAQADATGLELPPRQLPASVIARREVSTGLEAQHPAAVEAAAAVFAGAALTC